MGTSRFRASPRPDGDVIMLLETALASARRGVLRSVVVVALNPVYEVETGIAGALDQTHCTVLLGGLSMAANKLIRKT